MDLHDENEWDRTAGWPDRDVGELAGRQRTMVSHAQLRGLDISRSAIRRALRRGRLHTVHWGVYSLVLPAARPALAAEQAALLACGGAAVLSHETAARLHGLWTPDRRLLHVTVVAGDRRRPGLAVHRTRRLNRRDRARVGGLAVTGVGRTLVDLASRLEGRALERVVDEALRRTTRGQIGAALARDPARPGVGRVTRLLDPERPSADAWSAPERRLLGLIGRARLPLPEANIPVGPYRGDLVWRAQRVIVDYDSWQFHGGHRAFRNDRDRHNQLVADGWQVIHVTWEQLTERPEQVLVWIAAALARSTETARFGGV